MLIQLLSIVLSLSSQLSAQTLDSAYAEARGRIVPSAPKTCWTRGESAAADAAGMPLKVCVSRLAPNGKTVTIMGTALLAGGAQTEALYGEKPLMGSSEVFATIFSWEAGKGESDEESVVQVAFKRDAAGAVIPGSERLIAFHQCPERGCTYACGVTGVEFKRN